MECWIVASVEQNKAEPVLLGVCANFARWADVDPLLARVTAALVCLFFAPVAVPGYFVAAALLKSDARHQGKIASLRARNWARR